MSKPPIPLPSFSSSRSPVNGVNGSQPSSSGHKRLVDEISDEESPQKRRRVSDAGVDEISDDDDSDLIYKPSPKRRPSSLSVNTNGNPSTKPTTTPKTPPDRPIFTSINNHINQPLARQPHRPYTPKVLPPKLAPQKPLPEKEKRGADASIFWNSINPDSAPKPAPPIRQQKYESSQIIHKLLPPQSRKHQFRPDTGPVSEDEPFVQGYHRKIQGIASQGFIGATANFNNDSSKNKMEAKRAGMGIKIARKNAMRS